MIPPPQHPYYAPATMQHHDPADADMAALQPLITKIASATVLAASVLAILCVVQLVAFAGWLPIPAKLLCALMVAIAGPAFFIGWRLRFARKWAGILSLTLMGVLTVTSAGWTVYCWSMGYISLFGLLTPPATVIATVVTAISLTACDRATVARERLRAQGLDIGV